ncbi:MAG: sialidase family protein [Chthoniobacterales bacterium]
MPRLAFALVAALSISATPAFAASSALDASQLPAELRNAPLQRVSTGGLMRLDQNGSLVRAPRSVSRAAERTSGSTATAAEIALDPRVGANIRLGDDPPTLPSNQRAQAEPFIMRSRTNLDLVVATFQEGRFVDGGAIDCGYSRTIDGGLTWSRALLPGVTQAVGGPYFRATDPVVGIDLNNNVFINMDAGTDPAFNHGDVIVSRSSDGGATFAAPTVAYTTTNQNYFADKNWMTVNTFNGGPAPAGRVLVTFTLFTDFSNPNGPSPLVATYSDDGGQTWTPAQFITPTSSHMQGSQPLFLANGKVAVVYWNFTQANIPNGSEGPEVITSDDGGVTFGAPHLIGHINEWFEPSIRTGSFLPSATTDRTTSNIYLVVQANLGTDAAPIPKILFTKSTDNGATWSPFVPISDNANGTGVFNPAIVASPDGKSLTAAFYDRRNNPGSTTLVDMYEAQSFDGGATWQPNIRLSSVSSDVTLAPNTGTAQNPAYMLGDYLGVAEPTNRNIPAVPVWVDTRTGNPDPFVTRIGVAPQFDFTSWQAARLSYAQIQAPQYGLRQLNISTRDFVGSSDAVMIGGFIVTGPSGSTKKVMIRGLGPSLTNAGVPNVLSDPLLELHDHNGGVITGNDDWQNSSDTAEIPSGFQPSDPRESVIVATLSAQPAGVLYTAVMKGAHGETGNGLVEIYDLDAAGAAQFANISTRGEVLTGDDALIGGVIVGGGTGPAGTGSAKIVLRAIGPSLPAGTSPAPLQDPTLELHDVNGTALLFNDNWKDNQQAEIQATGLAPTDSRESAMLALLPPGNYTALVRGKNNSTGLALVESYNVQ